MSLILGIDDESEESEDTPLTLRPQSPGFRDTLAIANTIGTSRKRRFCDTKLDSCPETEVDEDSTETGDDEDSSSEGDDVPGG